MELCHVREELASGGGALPWIDSIAFIRRIAALARADHDAARCLAGPNRSRPTPSGATISPRR